MREFKEKQWFNQWWMQLINLSIVGLLGYFCYQWFILEKSVDKVSATDSAGQLITIIVLVLSFGLIYIFRLTTRIDENGIHYKFFPFHFSEKSISWYDVDKCYVRKYQPISEFGGWGIKPIPGGASKAYSTRGNMGIQCELKNGKKILFGTQKPDDAQQALNKFFKG